MKGVAVSHWRGAEPPTEARVRQLLAAEGLRGVAWSNAPGDLYAVHSHAYHKIIYVVRGSITFGLPDEACQALLCAGDRMELPAGTSHSAVVGPDGVHCLEAHVPV